MAVLPRISVTTDDALDLAVDALIVPVYRGAIEGPGAEDALRALGFDGPPRDGRFRGRLGETMHLAAPGLAARSVVLVGLGRMDELGEEQLRRAAGAASRAVAGDASTVATTLALADVTVGAVRAVAEGLALGAYRFTEHRSSPDAAALEEVTVQVPAALAEAAERTLPIAAAHAQAQCHARDLVNTPASHQSPQALCDRAAELVGDRVEVETWDERRLADERCGAILAVGQGSATPPRLLHLRYRPEVEPLAHVVLVGKGITFDSGGLTLKQPYTAMAKMKKDMGGAAAVIATVAALAELDVHVQVTGLCAIAENMPSGSAQRPSDVITARNGRTIEVMNTDAEGRLVMADALSYAAELEPDAIVDIATLTGASRHAVGARATAVYGNDDDLLRQILEAAGAAGEAAWHLPLWEELREHLDSEVADLTNVSTDATEGGGATIAGLFLREFVDGAPWVHLDIAGPSWVDRARHHHAAHATGWGVRTLLRWLEQSRATA